MAALLSFPTAPQINPLPVARSVNLEAPALALIKALCAGGLCAIVLEGNAPGSPPPHLATESPPKSRPAGHAALS